MYIQILIPTTREQYRRLYSFAGEYIYANSEFSVENRNVCDRMAIDLITSTAKIIFLIFFSIFLAVCAPLYINFFTDGNEMLIPIILPFVDPETRNGFFINLANQLIIAFFGSIAIPATEVITCVLRNNILVAAAVIENTIKELEDVIAHCKGFSVDHHRQFQNIILKTLDFDR